MPQNPRVALLVPASDYEEDWQPAYARKAAALEAAGLVAEQRVWTDPGDLAAFAVVLPLFAWGYQRRFGTWRSLLDRLETEKLKVVNPVALLRWNSDKSYLAKLAASGVATVPTLDVAALDEPSLARARAELACDEVVVKPAISAGADGTCRIAPGAPFPAGAAGQRRLVQPLMPAIFTEGEYSLFYFGGRYSHAIVKRPAAGDFRVQEQFGGHSEPWDATGAARSLAARALSAAPLAPVYARIDMVSDGAGRLHVMELELIEPSLFLHQSADKGAAFGEAIRRAL